MSITRIDVAQALLWCTACTATYGGLALALSEAGAFDTYNILFGSDANVRLAAISHGWSSGESLPLFPNSIHPLFQLYFAPVIRALSLVFGALGISALAGEAGREAIGLWVAPLLGGIQVALFYVICRVANANAFLAVGLTAIAATSFATALFAATPDHFALTAALLMFGFLWLACTWSAETNAAGLRSSVLFWAVYSAVAVGVTVTNIVAASLQHWAAQSLRSVHWRRALPVVGGAGLLALIAALCLGSAAYIATDKRRSPSASYVKADAIDRQGSPLGEAALMLGAALDGFTPATVHFQLGTDASVPAALGQPQFSAVTTLAERVQRWPTIVAGTLIALAGLGAFLWFRSGREGRTIALVCLAIVGWNVALHSVWGGPEKILFAEHWHPALLVLLAGLSRMPDRAKLGAGLGLLVLAVLQAANATHTFESTLSTLKSHRAAHISCALAKI